MEREALRLGEALREERSWEADGVTVLTASVTLPQLAGKSIRERRFNRYYRRFCRAYLTYCRLVLLPDAEASFRAALETSAPWCCARATLEHHVTCRTGAVCSVVCDAAETAYGAPAFRVRRADVWDLRAGLPLPLCECFPPHTRCRSVLLRFAREETARRIERGARFRDDWRRALRRCLNTRSFCLTDAGLCFFYPLCSIAGAKEGIVSYTMPYDERSGPFVPSIART